MTKYVQIASSLLFASLFALSGCASTVSSSNELCPKHGIALRTRTAYRISQDVQADPARAYIRIAGQYPKHTPWFYSKRRTEIHKDRETVTFCPSCDAELSNALRELP
jgi:hypothetical protein